MKRIFIILALVAIALFMGAVTYATADTEYKDLLKK